MPSPRNLVLLVLATLTLAAAPAPPPPGPAPDKPKLAYVHGDDRAAAGAFRDLLGGAGFACELVPLADAGRSDFTRHAAVLVGSDTEGGWGDAAAVDRAAGRPVLGLGEGGYEFFGRLGLAIGAPHGWHGRDTRAVPVDPARSPFWAGFADLPGGGGALRVYERSGHVGIHLPAAKAGVQPLGREAGSPAHYVLVQQGPRHVLWGFTESPAAMTPAGRALFLHVCRYVVGQGRPAAARREGGGAGAKPE
jgi:hypothetical protein